GGAVSALKCADGAAAGGILGQSRELGDAFDGSDGFGGELLVRQAEHLIRVELADARIDRPHLLDPVARAQLPRITTVVAPRFRRPAVPPDAAGLPPAD